MLCFFVLVVAGCGYNPVQVETDPGVAAGSRRAHGALWVEWAETDDSIDDPVQIVNVFAAHEAARVAAACVTKDGVGAHQGISRREVGKAKVVAGAGHRKQIGLHMSKKSEKVTPLQIVKAISLHSTL